jgi:hypothetical protein
VFDTVAATRGSLDLNPDTYPASGIVFENGTIGKNIEKAVHLVSIDEKRLAFQPTLFNKDDRVTEVWFSGVHSDVGGGYWYDGLSDITLKFMIDSIKGNPLKLDAGLSNFLEVIKQKKSTKQVGYFHVIKPKNIKVPIIGTFMLTLIRERIISKLCM